MTTTTQKLPAKSELARVAPLPEEALLVPADLADLTTDELRVELTRSLSLTAGHLTRLAWIVRLLEERGDDLADLKLGLLSYLRQIAYGRVLPELVVRYADAPLALAHVSALPLPDQRKLADGGSVTLIVRGVDGTPDHRRADPARMTRTQLAQVFGRGRIRDEAEQMLILEDRGREKAKPALTNRVGKVRIERRRGGIVVGKSFAPLADVVEALAAYQSDDSEAGSESLLTQVVIPLTEGEHAALKQAALDGGTAMVKLARRALIAYGLLTLRQ